jgi:hypothetical protein
MAYLLRQQYNKNASQMRGTSNYEKQSLKTLQI